MKTITLQFHVEDGTPALEAATPGRLTAGDLVNFFGAALADTPGGTPTIYQLSEDEIVRQGDAVCASRYRETVADIAEDLKRAIRDGEITDTDDAETWLHETIDGHGDVIYTSRAQDVCRHSSNDAAYFDDFGSDGAVGDGGIEWSKLAYCALLADVREELGDLDELITELTEPEEDEDDEEDGDDQDENE